MPRRKIKLETIPMYQYSRDVQKAIERSPFLNAEEEIDLITKAKAGDIAARDRVLESHLLSVISVANQHRNRGVEFADLIQEGNIGLMKGFDRFDLSHGVRFNTYALWWVRHTIQRCVQDHGKTIRIPVHQQETRMKIDRFTLNHIVKFGHKPSDDAIAKHLGISLKRLYKFYQREISYRVSLTRDKDEYDGQYLDEIDLEDKGCNPVDTEVQIVELVTAIKNALLTLKQISKNKGSDTAMRDMEIFMKRLFEEDSTLQSIANVHGVSRERIRQICLNKNEEIQSILSKQGIDAEFLEHS